VTITPATRVRQRAGVLCREIDGEAVLLDPTGGTYYGLNETGTRAWMLIGAGAPLGVVRDGLCGDYDVEEERAWADLAALVHDLTRHGLLEILPPAEPPAVP
jgi:hypothetical protein